MKQFLLVVLLKATLLTSVLAQSGQIYPLEKGVYMVVGSFENESNAVKFRNKLNRDGRTASISYSDQTKFYYVHIRTYDTVDEAIPQVAIMRTTTSFTDAWVLAYSIDSGMTATSTIPIDHKKEEIQKHNPVVEQPIVNTTVISNDPEPNPPQSITTIDQLKNEKNQYKVYLNTYNKNTNTKVQGKVKIIDPDRLKQIRAIPAHELSTINDPHNQSNAVQFIAEIFGYKKNQHDVTLSGEISEEMKAFMRIQGDTMLIDFPLTRYNKGDVAIMYNVFFYKDAAIMKPESQFEVNSLLEMLTERPEIKIAISGHTNGNSAGRLIEIDGNVPEYFSLKQATKEGRGSAKELSLKRAEIIKKYLVNNGISENRMDVIGWGGKKPIYEKFDRLAHKNVRVEIEILED